MLVKFSNFLKLLPYNNLFGHRENEACELRCLSQEGSRCLANFTLSGATYDGCVPGSLVDTTQFSSADFVCPTETNSTSGAHQGFQKCADVGNTCKLYEALGCLGEPCQNGGVCQTVGSFEYSCDCSSTGGFGGPNCSSDAVFLVSSEVFKPLA